MRSKNAIETFMSDHIACCTPDTSLEDAAKLMIECDCGSIPVTERGSNRLVGIITDRDIACRAVASGRDSSTMKVRDIMSSPVISAHPETSLDECCRLMEENQVRRVPVTDGDGHCVGIVAQADIALQASPKKAAEVLHDISLKSSSSSAMVGH
jgi:CBS domain-containing protein